jgi:hypothetical protein
VRFSHSTASNGEIFPSVKYRSKGRPLCAPVFSGLLSVIGEFPVSDCFTVAIPFLRNLGLPLVAGNPLILLLCVPQGAGWTLKVAPD